MSFAFRADSVTKTLTPPRDASFRRRERNSMASIAPVMSPLAEDETVMPGPLKLIADVNAPMRAGKPLVNTAVVKVGGGEALVRSRSLSRERKSIGRPHSATRPRSVDALSNGGNRSKRSGQSLALDDKWAEKQTASFTDWLNFTFAQAQLVSNEAVSSKKMASSSMESLSAASLDDQDISVDNSTLDARNSIGTACAAGIRELWQRRLDAQVRQAGVALFHSEELQFPLRAIGVEVNDGRLEIRSDNRDLHADLGLQEQLFELLFYYELPWLRLGLEIVCGEVINIACVTANTFNATGKSEKVSRRSSVGNPNANTSSHHSDGRLRQAIKLFVHEHVLRDKNIQAQFSKQKLLYPAQERKMKELLRRHALKKFLALVLFLDRARSKQLLPKAMLFTHNALYKSSCDIVTAFCRNFLRGEGDILRHLSLLNYYVTFTQSYTDEFNYEVKNLAVDLRDGVRLVRLYDLLRSRCGRVADANREEDQLSKQLRVPAVSRLQKLFNVGLLINALYTPIELKPEPKAIVDGSRDMTLLLLWKLLFSFELRMMITPEKVREEIEAICRSHAWRRSVYSEEELRYMAVKACSKSSAAKIAENVELNNVSDEIVSLSTANDADASESLHKALLLWCKTIAEGYDVPVYNLTSCLADGRALCLLIHYYHPSILPLKSLRKTTAHLMEAALDGASMLDTSADRFMELPSSVTQSDLQKALHGERRNYLTLKKACNAIGGVPMILNEFDSRNIPEEKTMIVFLGYLFARLVESSEQVRAAIRLQRWYRTAIEGTFAPPVQQSQPLGHVGAAAAEGEGELFAAAAESAASVVAPAAAAAPAVQGICDVPIQIVLSTDQAALFVQRWWKQLLTARREAAARSAEDCASVECDASYEVQLADEFVDDDAVFNMDQSMLTGGRRSSVGCYAVDFTTEDSDEEPVLTKVGDDERAELIDVKAIAAEAAEADAVVVVVTAEGQKQRELNEGVQQKLMQERRRLVCAELLLQQKAKRTFEIGVQQVTLTAQHQLEEAKRQAELEQQLLNEKLAAVQAQEEEARRQSQLQLQREAEARSNAEDKLRQLESIFAHDRDSMAVAIEEKQRVFAEWEAYRQQQQAEQARREAEEAQRKLREEEMRQRAEEIAAAERAARQAAEAAIITERRAREQAEAKLRAIEEARLAAEAEHSRREIEAKVLQRKQQHAALRLQSFWRMTAAMVAKKRSISAVIMMQSCFRGRLAMWMYRSALLAVMILQAYWRRKMCVRQLHRMSAAATLIQQQWRRYRAERHEELQYCAAVAVQRWCRTRHQQQLFRRTCRAVVCIQSAMRRKIAEQRLVVLRRGAVKLQSIVRSRICRRMATRRRAACIKLQRVSMRALQRWQRLRTADLNTQVEQRVQQLRVRAASRCICRFVFTTLKQRLQKSAALCISRWYKGKIFLLRIRKLCRGFLRLQVMIQLLSLISLTRIPLCDDDLADYTSIMKCAVVLCCVA